MSAHSDNYLKEVNEKYKTGNSTEHTYRKALEILINRLASHVKVTNEPKNVTDCGNPDYVVTKNKIPIGFIEAKDIGKDLNSKIYKEQFTRYKTALDNLIITDYLRFQFFEDGQLANEIRIGEIEGKEIKPLTENHLKFETLLSDFCTIRGQTIRSPKRLAEMMAGKARLLENILTAALTSDEKTQENTTLKSQYQAFKEILIRNLEVKDFADIYAQTLTYGLFAARLHDTSLNTFSRQEAAELIPKSNPFLRNLFQYVGGYDIDERIKLTVDNLAEVFRTTDIKELLRNFGKNTQTQDPIIHFYETFLAEYDPKLRKSRGVWYTPQPVVNFIVRAVDDILKTEFGLSEGLADYSKVETKEKKFHKVQILDPATGTGTFLAEVVKHIYEKNFKTMPGIWSDYVKDHLIPRLNGFEILMASYAMAHLKLDMLLSETGYKPKKEKRFNVYLTNSLEEHHPDTGALFSNWLTSEANEANHVKRDNPVMVVMGNPPYSGESQNKGKWIMQLMDDYKKEPDEKGHLKERNPKWINDDYVKFIRYAQHFIEKNGSGVVAFINPHGFLDNPTFRGMRWHLLKTYDKIYTIDLHGNSKKKEASPDGSKDENVFDIMQGVSINLFIKTGLKKKNSLGQVFHYDLYGKRNLKYNFLTEHSIKSIDFKTVIPFKNNYSFKDIDEKLFNDYNNGINPTELFQVNIMGFQTHRDEFCIDINKEILIKRLTDFADNTESDEEIIRAYGIKSTSDFNIKKAQIELQKKDIKKEITKCTYRPFETRYIYFDRILVDRPRKELITNSKGRENILLGVGRQDLAVGNIEWCLATVSKYPVDANMFRRGGVNLSPLYLYPETHTQQPTERIPNLNKEIVNEISEKLGLERTDIHGQLN